MSDIAAEYKIDPKKSRAEFEAAAAKCRKVYDAKLKDYGASWRLLRPSSLTDQILIKARRIRTLESGVEARIHEGILPEFMGIVNYGIIALIQCKLGFANEKDITPERALELYDQFMAEACQLMLDKSHDYGEAWRMMRVSSFTDIILTKLMRNKEIEDNLGAVAVSEGVEGNYIDMVIYSIFAIIKLTAEK